VLEIVGADEAAKTLARSRWRRYREHGANPESHNL
jgi:DNA polymerase IIIc chi subunit